MYWSSLIFAADHEEEIPVTVLEIMKLRLGAAKNLPKCYVMGCAQSLNHANSLRAHQAPLSMGFSRQKYWSVLPFPPPQDLPGPAIKPSSLGLQVDSLPLSCRGSLNAYIN